MEHYEMPLGLGMALAQNPEALQKFANLTETKKQEIIQGTHALTSKADMKRYVENIISAYLEESIPNSV